MFIGPYFKCEAYLSTSFYGLIFRAGKKPEKSVKTMIVSQSLLIRVVIDENQRAFWPFFSVIFRVITMLTAIAAAAL